MSLYISTVILSVAALSCVANAAPYCQYQPSVTVGKAIYFLTNGDTNGIVALPIGSDGMLSQGTITKTGGAGSVSLESATKKPALQDALNSQSSLTIVGKNIFAVNAGSNTVTMLEIDPWDPTCLSMVGQPAAVPGDFPVTVAASAKNHLVCTGTTGALAGISCASYSKMQGIGPMDAIRPFDLGQSTPPAGPLNTVSQTFFSHDESMLLTTVKGDPPVNNTGFLSVFDVMPNETGNAELSTKDTRSSPNGTAVLFGTVPIHKASNKFFATDASFGAAILTLDEEQATVGAKQAIEGQQATCWATISNATQSAYVTDVAKNRIVEMSLQNASIFKELDFSDNGDTGLIDLQAAGNFVYALAPGNGTAPAQIVVLDVSGGQGSMKIVQQFSLDGIATNTAQGMAVLI
ncbi:hypothetical protein E8E13_011060 [Curvularia kusanoi]|uniref:3-carboxymuconate cyclase n=1 Tax=Curvularia kusanoi TaxID=90978 RepID=A0A9P4WD48_CURKU|nr:hypothetical protein E8E13_011060 [Curvularia kusanoi]